MRVLEGVLTATGRTDHRDWPYKEYQHDPVAFAREVLGMTIWSRQEDMLTAIRDHDRVAVRAGRKVSKSTTAVIAALWWAYSVGGKVFMTSMSHPQIKAILWAELRSILPRSPLWPFNKPVPLDPGTGLTVRNGGNIVGRSAAVRENMQGYSGAKSLYLIDEASGMNREIFEAIDGNTAGGGKIVLMGNPTRTSGIYYDAFHRERAEWAAVRISSRESPNVVEGREVIPGLALRSWVQRQDEKLGKDHPYVMIHVDGLFPTSGANAVITLALSEAAQERWRDTPAEGLLEIGVDVGRFGDDATVVYPRRGLKAYSPLVGDKTDTHAVVELVKSAILTHGRQRERPRVKVDVIGIGAGVFDVLKRDYGHLMEVHAVNVAERATGQEDEHELGPRYAKLRDQLWFALRDWLKEGGSFPSDDDTHGDLIAPQFSFDSAGRYRVTSKEDLKEATGRSPDRADALALSVYTPPPPGITDATTAESLYR